MKGIFAGWCVWADLDRPNKWGKYGVTVVFDKAHPLWTAFQGKIAVLCSEEDVCVAAEDLTRNLGLNSATRLNEYHDTESWHESDQCLTFKTNKDWFKDLNIRTGDSVVLNWGSSIYSFINDEGQHIEGVALYLNDIRKDSQ